MTPIDDGVEQILEHLVGLLVTSHTPHGVDERMTWVVHTSLDHLFKGKNPETFIHKKDAVANPGFPGGANILFGKVFAEICMKMKEIGPSVPLRSATEIFMYCVC